MAAAPVYCATKAALRSFALSLRHQMAVKGIHVVEVCPPHVNTDLGAPGSNGAGMDLKAYIDSAMAGFEQGREEKERLFAQLNPKP